MSNEIANIHIQLLNEGTPTARPVKALALPNGFYQILPDDYDPDDEEWEFVPGDIVRCETDNSWREPLFLAVEKME